MLIVLCTMIGMVVPVHMASANVLDSVSWSYNYIYEEGFESRIFSTPYTQNNYAKYEKTTDSGHGSYVVSVKSGGYFWFERYDFYGNEHIVKRDNLINAIKNGDRLRLEFEVKPKNTLTNARIMVRVGNGDIGSKYIIPELSTINGVAQPEIFYTTKNNTGTTTLNLEGGKWYKFSVLFDFTDIENDLTNPIYKDPIYNGMWIFLGATDSKGANTLFDNVVVRTTSQRFAYSTYLPVSSLSLSNNFEEIRVGDSFKNTAYVYPPNASNPRVTWASSNPWVAEVDNNGYVTANSVGTATITAKSSNGKTASCTVTVTDSTILNYDNFGYKFGNSRDSFGYPDNYSIPGERYIQAGVSLSKAGKGWGGNCFGMSTSSVLFYKNVLKEENYDKSVSVPKGFDRPNSQLGDFIVDTRDIKLRWMIELFQVTQYLPQFNYSNFSATNIARELSNGTPVIFAIYEKGGGGHAVVAYGYERIGNAYKFYLYDCSGFVTHLMYINENEWSFVYDDNEWSRDYEWSPRYYFTYAETKLVHDKIKSKNANNAASLFSLRNEPTYTYIFRPAEDLTITNSAGQVSTIINGELTGAIENACVIPSSYLAEEPTCTIILPTDTYTIVGTSDEVVSTAFADDYMSAEVTSKSNTPITISSDLKTISTDYAENEEYSVRYTTYDNIFDEMVLTGTAEGKLTTVLEGAAVSVDGANTLTASASVSGTEVSAVAENLAEAEDVQVVCENANSGATLQILGQETELTEKTALPERLQVEVPIYDLESGTYTEGQLLSFTKDDETIVYYTTDGSIPSADNGIIYSLPVEVNKSMTVKAISTKYGYADSEIVELNYTLPEVIKPQANLESGEYDDVISVALSTYDVNDKIYYTLDGSDPMVDGILYTVPINLSEDTYLQAYTLRNGCVSEISEYEYTITPKHPIYFQNSLTNQDGEALVSENIAEVTKIRLNPVKMTDGEVTATFIVAFYDEDNQLLSFASKKATITEAGDMVEIDISEDVSSAHKIKVFAWDGLESLSSLSNEFEEYIDIE